VSVTNINRQCPATTKTVGKVKVDAMKLRLLDINPQVEVEAICDIYCEANRDRFQLETYDYVIDAIDSLSCKAALILHATSLPSQVKFFSSMGAALKLDPTQIRVDEFWKVQGCPLARALRQRFKRDRTFPGRKFKVVYSPEVQPNRGPVLPVDEPDVEQAVDWNERKAQINGTLAHTTAIFGFTLAGLVVQDLVIES
jgi:tRNA A37 threonylcarbamoyladenosine dehydratase